MEPCPTPSQDPRRPRRALCTSLTDQDGVQRTATVSPTNGVQTEPGTRDFNAINGRAKSHKLCVFLELLPPERDTPPADGHVATPGPSSKVELPVIPSQEAVLPEMSSKYALSFLTWMATEEIHSIQQHREHALGVAEMWHEDKLR